MDSPSQPQPTVGLRERKKAETKDRIARAAVEKFVTLGSEGATIGAIAEAATVSPRTFHNYFHHREDALIHFCVNYVAQVTDAIRAMPADHDPIMALESYIEEFMARPADDLRGWSTLSRVGNHLASYYQGLMESPAGASGSMTESEHPQGLAMLRPLVAALQERSNGTLPEFQGYLLLTFAMSITDTVQGMRYLDPSIDAAATARFIHDGFNSLREGFHFRK
ncbi:TetR/AcrR family transcriptional regulator [Corynebacterium sp. 320]|uniref:TetR/AcrR family transcriptional regulator n=1 Tax=Corynebacterium TaxID=1716 RepID=UPI00125CCDD9|nr:MULTISPECIES: TetR/AcrR family transcriptional regulator [Corynebacterium]KAB1504078.1 TetR/AcrR family transcriptional regulator [Corynebacterium sp. 320]KAB3528214.1 TetR/AcrR family transcriptional regulator [Corynebacterium sp. 250]QNP91754.1 TetR/AcrR family transcriptional regulator [Corynebacterium zhongnanshanii]